MSRIEAVMLKPDASETRVQRRQYKALLRAFRIHLQTPVGRSSLADPRARAAASQAHERSRLEPAFRRDRQSRVAPHRLAIQAGRLSDVGLKRVDDLVVAALESFGYRIVARVAVELSRSDVDAIYGDAGGAAGQHLHDYLDEQTVQIIVLAGGPPPWVLHHWKTFIRHFLLDRRDPSYTLRNLFHVAEADREFLEKIVKRDKIRLGGFAQ